MTKAYSQLGDNDGVCEGCNCPGTEYDVQTKYPVFLGGGMGWGTLWLCSKCLEKKPPIDLSLGIPLGMGLDGNPTPTEGR